MLPGEHIRNFYRLQGRKQANEEIVAMIENQLCIDFRNDAKCNHGGCLALWDLACLIVKKQG